MAIGRSFLYTLYVYETLASLLKVFSNLIRVPRVFVDSFKFEQKMFCMAVALFLRSKLEISLV